MPTDKSWVKLDKRLPEYEKGVDEFLDIAFTCLGVDDTIRCPCRNCLNFFHLNRDDVKYHLFYYGMDEKYDPQIHHGEIFYCTSSNDEEDDLDDGDEDPDDVVMPQTHDDVQTLEMLYDIHRGQHCGDATVGGEDEWNTRDPEEPNVEDQKFFRLLKDAEQKLYPNCEGFSKLSFIVELYQLKCLNGWSDTSLDSLFKLLKNVLPRGNIVPESIYEARKVIQGLGLNYVKIDACINDCILYRNDYAKAKQCPVCGESRWKFGLDDGNIEVNSSSSKRNKIPCKILRYFPLKSRLQKLFMSP